MSEKLDFIKVKPEEFPRIKEEDHLEVIGRLRALEGIAQYITDLRQSYTRLLIANNVEPTEENTATDLTDSVESIDTLIEDPLEHQTTPIPPTL